MTMTTEAATFTLRQANTHDLPALRRLVERSLRRLAIRTYDENQVDGLVNYLDGVDPQLVEDGTLYVAEIDDQIVGCGAWSRFNSLYGSGNGGLWLDPARDAAKIRNVFVDPDWSRRGIGRQLMGRCEAEAAYAGFRRLELLATLSGQPLYTSLGYREVERIRLELPDGTMVPALKMEKALFQMPRTAIVYRN